MSTLVVLAIVAALVGALGFALTSRSGRTRGRHGGGSAAVPRALITAVPLLVGTALLWAFREQTELGLAAIALWWACLPWLAVTGRLSAWGHAGWALGANAGAAGLVYLAWLITSSGLSVPVAVGAWALWAVVTTAVVLFLGFTREVAAVDRVTAEPAGRGAARAASSTPRPAMAVSWLAGGAAAVALSLVVQPGPPSAPASAAQSPVDSASTASPTAPTSSPERAPTTASAPTTSAATPRPVSTTSVARSGDRTTTPAATETTTTKRRKPSTTTTASPTTSSLITLTITPTTRKKPKPTPTEDD